MDLCKNFWRENYRIMDASRNYWWSRDSHESKETIPIKNTPNRWNFDSASSTSSEESSGLSSFTNRFRLPTGSIAIEMAMDGLTINDQSNDDDSWSTDSNLSRDLSLMRYQPRTRTQKRKKENDTEQTKDSQVKRPRVEAMEGPSNDTIKIEREDADKGAQTSNENSTLASKTALILGLVYTSTKEKEHNKHDASTKRENANAGTFWKNAETAKKEAKKYAKKAMKTALSVLRRVAK